MTDRIIEILPMYSALGSIIISDIAELLNKNYNVSIELDDPYLTSEVVRIDALWHKICDDYLKEEGHSEDFDVALEHADASLICEVERLIFEFTRKTHL